MNDDTKEGCAVFAIGTVILALLIGVASLAFWYQCHAKWDLSGMQAITWRPVQGCMAQLPDGRWLPTERLREIDLPRNTK